MNISEEIANLKEIIDKSSLSADQTKLFESIAEILNKITNEISFLEKDHDDLCEQVDEIDEDLGRVEDEIFGENSCDCSYDECDNDCKTNDEMDCNCDENEVDKD